MEEQRCMVCGGEIREGQRYVELGGRRVHLECLRGLVASRLKRIPADMEAALDALEATLYALQRTREALGYAEAPEIREVLGKHLSMLEEQALILGVLVEAFLRDQGLV